jgi:aldehyde:ferredoxin oxidoreductase
MFDERTILHSLLVCDFPANFLNITLEEYVSMLNYVTGGEFSLEMLKDLADRAETQIRLFNCREGFTREDDTLPQRFYSEPFQKGTAKGRILEKNNFDLMLEDYYYLRGWNKDGYPKKETLEKLGIA